MGTAAQLNGKEKVGDREAHVLIFEPTSGSLVRHYIDAETYLPIKSVIKVDVPQIGQQVEQTTEFLDYREVEPESKCRSARAQRLRFRTTRSPSTRWSTTSR